MTLIKVKSRGTDNVTGRKNLIINGAMRIAQRTTQATSVASSGYFATDRMKYYDGSDIVATVEQVSDAPSGSGFQYSHKVTATTADTSIGATELQCPLWYIIEKQDVDARLAYGTSSAKPLTMSFWIKSNVTGTYTISAYRSTSPARVQAQTYTISAANTWEYKTLTFLGDTTEAIDTDLNFYFNGFVGGDYDNTSTTSGWATYNTGNWAGGHTATWGDTTNDTWQITGLQLEVGVGASDFEHRSIGEELALCKRYYHQIGTGDAQYTPVGVGNTEVSFSNLVIFYPEKMRAAPTLTYSGLQIFDASVNTAITSTRSMYAGTQSANLQLFHSGANLTRGRGVYCNLTGTSSYMALNAEL